MLSDIHKWKTERNSLKEANTLTEFYMFYFLLQNLINILILQWSPYWFLVVGKLYILIFMIREYVGIINRHF